MTLVNIDLRNQGYETDPDDRVVFYSLLVREGEFGTISTAPVEVPLVDGKATVDLAPGPVGVQILAGQVADTRIKIGEVPPSGTTTLNAVMMVTPAYTPALQAQFLKAIQDAQAQATTELGRVLDGELNQYRDYASEAITVATNVNQRVAALEERESLEPGAAVDGQTANLIRQPGTLTRSAVNSAIGDTLLVVTHGDDAHHLRPDTPRRVLWLGTVVPHHRRAGDLVPEVVPIPAPWTPEMLDLVAWYDPANGYESGTVSQITDRGPRNLHMGIGGTGGISIDTSTLALPAFANAGTAFATSPVLPAGAWDHPVTVYMVASLSTLPTVSSLFDNGPGPISTRVAMWATEDGALGLNQGISVNSVRDTVSANAPFLLAATFSGGANTYAEVEGSVVVGPANAGSNKLGSVRIFANGAGANIADAVIGDVVIAHSVTPEQHSDTVAWLREKWGLV